jgi:hypothetical protein
MAALIALAAVGLFAAGVTAGIIGVVCLAIRREDKNLTLTSQATDHVTQAGRWLNGVAFALRTAPPLPAGRRRLASPPARQPGNEPDQFTGPASQAAYAQAPLHHGYMPTRRAQCSASAVLPTPAIPATAEITTAPPGSSGPPLRHR